MTHTLTDLIDELEDARDVLSLAKQRVDKLEKEIDGRFAEKSKQLFLDNGKDTGTLHFDDDGFDVAVEIKKLVKWDQELLIKIFDSMPAETARHYCKLDIRVDERKYTAATPDVQTVLLPARTVIPSTPSYTFKKKD